jgi:GNAT superfamily N-acetyltransferase
MDEITVEAWQSCFKGAVPDEVLDAQEVGPRGDYFRSHLPAEPPYFTLVASDDGTVVGYIHLGPCRDDDGGDRSEIWGLYVVPRLHRRGIGRVLLTRALEWAGAAGHSEATLWTLRDVAPTRWFYEAAGGEWDLGEKVERVGGHDLHQVRYRFRLPGREPV